MIVELVTILENGKVILQVNDSTYLTLEKGKTVTVPTEMLTTLTTNSRNNVNKST